MEFLEIQNVIIWLIFVNPINHIYGDGNSGSQFQYMSTIWFGQILFTLDVVTQFPRDTKDNGKYSGLIHSILMCYNNRQLPHAQTQT